MGLENKQIVVIGGSSGIGLATAWAALSEGAKVVISGRSEERLEQAARELGGDVTTVVADAKDAAQTEALFASLDRVDHIFTTAGMFADDQKLQADDALIAEILDTRTLGAIYAARYGVAKMTDGGSVTFMSGTAAWRPMNAPVSSASCAAVEALARSLAVQFAPIRFNTICPGFVRTPLLEAHFGEQANERLEQIGSGLPVGRIGRAEEVAEAVLFMMKNGYVNGLELTIDGGGRLV